MSNIGDAERDTQDRLVELFDKDLRYDYLGNWQYRANNSNVEPEYLRPFLQRSGCRPEVIDRAIEMLQGVASNRNRNLYDSNKGVYTLLRYGAQVKAALDEDYETVEFIDWDTPSKNDFAFAEEVTLRGDNERRPDIVLYINGIAFAVLELKKSSASVETGIRQSISNQQEKFNAWFFSTVQFVFAGNNSQGLRYGTVGTPEDFFLSWKEDEHEDDLLKLDKYLLKMCNKERIIDLMMDFVLFDAGHKKVPRPHQYFAVKAAQAYALRHQGGVIWHTQGSGKSIVMVLLAKWLLRSLPDARVVVITDRSELDKQIEGVFAGTDVPPLRTSSGADLMDNLAQASPRLMCSLVHKFATHEGEEFDEFIKELTAKPQKVVGDIFAFVDECHRTQKEGGKLHDAMMAVMPEATFIGFTGTPLLRKDADATKKVFGGYIHTYKFDEAVEDGVVLDFLYESRNVEQFIGDPTAVDTWFEKRTKGLNERQRAELRKQWGTMQRVRSSRSRLDMIVSDIEMDFSVKPELLAPNSLGNAMLIANSIPEACRYYDLFQKTALAGQVALITSYTPRLSDVSLEDTGAGTETDKEFVFSTYERLLKGVTPTAGLSAAETYRDQARDLFVTSPSKMRLLIVVDMCLTGFDPPACTYEYIDKFMQDHGLFQAICRTDRVVGDWKEYGNIVDYRGLFTHLQNSIAVYSSELDHSEGGVPPEITVTDRLVAGRRRLLAALEAVQASIEPVAPPKGELEYIHFFCGNSEIPADLEKSSPLREALYTQVASLVRAYASITDDLPGAGFSTVKISEIKERVEYFAALRDTIKYASGESLDTKVYEADMRQLLDTYIEAEKPVRSVAFSSTPMLSIIAATGIAAAIDALPPAITRSKKATAETITNNVRATIVRRQLSDPAYYEKMSTLLGQILAELRAQQIDYAKYLEELEKLAKKIDNGYDDSTPPELTTPGARALYNNLPGESGSARATLATTIATCVRQVRQADWRGDSRKERALAGAIADIVGDDALADEIFQVIRQQDEF